MRKYRITVLALLMCFMKSARVLGVKNITHGISRHIRSIGFPEGSTLGIFFALGIPLDIPDKSISVAFYFEANYGLPNEWNSTYFYEEDYYTKRSLSRQLVYKMLINKMERLGYSGLDCLLRMICEATRYSLSENGLLGDILQIILTPSTSRSENLPNEIIEAEYGQQCDQRYKKCSMNPLDLISYYINL
ncbi:hypothetical protein EAG_06428 [Camponotus floridanus]|uniref:Uncharacterized protein n=1 Tax=Camponotus floridanus TaxID=104421 RepID=E1ZY87_CAMFO|nr:uncharacterized protein LOC105256079 [Camponotus floridanus]EFN73786.1 hypothetical protein EAG_06428 [Camponotus floridanus]